MCHATTRQRFHRREAVSHATRRYSDVRLTSQPSAHFGCSELGESRMAADSNRGRRRGPKRGSSSPRPGQRPRGRRPALCDVGPTVLPGERLARWADKPWAGRTAGPSAHKACREILPRPFQHCWTSQQCHPTRPYSHSIVAGGLLLMSYTTRFTPFTSLMMRVEMRASSS